MQLHLLKVAGGHHGLVGLYLFKAYPPRTTTDIDRFTRYLLASHHTLLAQLP